MKSRKRQGDLKRQQFVPVWAGSSAYMKLVGQRLMNGVKAPASGLCRSTFQENQREAETFGGRRVWEISRSDEETLCLRRMRVPVPSRSALIPLMRGKLLALKGSMQTSPCL
jgi:hypothetical protein